MVRLILADDHKLVREGVKALLRDEEIIIAGEASSGSELLELLHETNADVVLLDISMPEMDGFQCIRQMQELHVDTKVLVLSMLENEYYVQQMMGLGAYGYILKTAGKEELKLAIQLVAKGIPYISSYITLNLLRKVNENVSITTPVEQLAAKDNTLKDLSKRELEVLNLISNGFTNAAIAEQLFTSKRTIETHRQNLLEKTQTKNTAALIKYAILRGLIS
ncbi:response regulator transcription factor [Pontibacter rugosus]|uniref:Response regulator n=1 Tax=Pontibacter rugosus TaxID=1745966 RepID=A0ABW3STV2_9BACT